MYRIELNINQKTYLLKILEKAKKYRYRDYEEEKITKEMLDIDLNIIDNLIGAVNGKVSSDYYQAKNINYKKEKERKIYIPTRNDYIENSKCDDL